MSFLMIPPLWFCVCFVTGSLSGTLQIRLGWLDWLATCLNLLSAEVMSMHNHVVLLQLSAENRTPVLLVALPALH